MGQNRSNTATNKPSSATSGSILLVFLSPLSLLFLPVLCAGDLAQEAKREVVTLNSPHPDHAFQHLAVDTRTGTLYLSAVNHLHRLTPDLQLQQTVVTGPLPDNPDCPPPFLPGFRECDHPKHSTDSFSKVLLVDDSHQKLIACWSLFQGYCEKRALRDISVNETFYIPVVANLPNVTTFAFIAPGPTDHPWNIHLRPNVLYISSTWSDVGDSIWREDVPAFASRNLNNFSIHYRDNFRRTVMKIEMQQRSSFPVHYIYGFGSEDFSYMVTIQKRSAISSSFVSKIFRVCQYDPYFYSYVEMQLECLHEGTDYNLVQAAYRHQADKTLAESLGISTEEDVLFAVFSKGIPESSRPTDKTALCVYPMRQVRRLFTRTIQKCFDGIGNTGPDHITKPLRCLKITRNRVTDDYCGEEELNHPLGGTTPIQGKALMIFPSSQVSAIAVTTMHQHTFVFLGTSNGTLMKVSINSSLDAVLHEQLTIAPGQGILKDMLFDTWHEHLYVLTNHAVFRVKTHDCSRYTTAWECVEARDPTCGWCPVLNGCSPRETCPCRESGWLTHSSGEEQCLRYLLAAANKTAQPPTLTLHIHDVPYIEEAAAYHCTYTPWTNASSAPAQPSIFSARTGHDGIQCVSSSAPSLSRTATGNDTYSWNFGNDSCQCFTPEADLLGEEEEHCYNWTSALWQLEQRDSEVRPQQQQQQKEQHKQHGQSQQQPAGVSDDACPAGLAILDSQGLYCLSTGWGVSLTPLCIARPTCRVDPDSPSVRALSDRTKIYPGEIVTYECAEGAGRRPDVGTAERVCLINGTLTGTEIICESGRTSAGGQKTWAIAVSTLGVLCVVLLAFLAAVLCRSRRGKQSSKEVNHIQNQRGETMPEADPHRNSDQAKIHHRRSLPAPPTADEEGLYSEVDYLSSLPDRDAESERPQSTAAATSAPPSEPAAVQRQSVYTPEGYLILLNDDDRQSSTETTSSSRRENTLGQPAVQQPVQAGGDRSLANPTLRGEERSDQATTLGPAPLVKETPRYRAGPDREEDTSTFPSYELASIFSSMPTEQLDAGNDADVQLAAQRQASYERPTVYQNTLGGSQPYDKLCSSDELYDDCEEAVV